MNRRWLCLSLLSATLLGTGLPADAAPAADAMQSAQYLVGRWNCAHTVGDFSGTYTTTFANALGNRWLRQTYEFPAVGAEPAIHAEYFLGFDPRVERWERFGAHSNGMYFAMRTTNITETAWTWQYVLPGADATATWTKRSDGEFVIDGPEYRQNGQLVREHHDCKKA